MSYKINNAIIKRKNDGSNQFDLVDPDGIFDNKEVLVAIDSDDLITIQLLINGIIENDFKNWNEINQFGENESIKNLFIKLGYSKEDLIKLLKSL
ncbi:hypothetical protein [uncultured Methanobrevibacter sp.]|uniref:hypothetical protein n=1 Tax=uncultured Methanobrevibacter sp. TaxID=253161 RepID=UPI0025DBEECC|nr:hypothetical protein [uncultured Methanobrevibacter sp.]